MEATKSLWGSVWTAGVPPAAAGSAAVPHSRRLFIRPDPDAVPILRWRVVAVIAAAVDEDPRGLVARHGLERLAKMADRGPPVTPLIAFEPGFIGADQPGQL